MWCDVIFIMCWCIIWYKENEDNVKKKLLMYICICSCFFNCDIKKIMFVYEYKYFLIELKVVEILLKRIRLFKD